MRYLYAIALSLLLTTAGWANTIDASIITPGTTTATAPGATVQAVGGTFSTSAFGIGIQLGHIAREIDTMGEALVVVFDIPQVVTEIAVGLLFAEGFRQDQVDEAMMVDAFGDGFTRRGFLRVVNPTTATWTGSASVPTNLSPGNRAGSGVWEVLSPFAGLRISRLEFTPVDFPGIDNSYNSDFTMKTLCYLPEPGTAVLLGFGLAGLTAAGGRRKALREPGETRTGGGRDV
jgi:hypothetical protein